MNKKLLKYRRLILSALLSGLMILTVGCCVDPNCNDDYDDEDGRYSEVINTHQAIPLSTQTLFYLEAINGRIDIEGTTADSVVYVWANKKVKANSQWEADRYLEELEVRVSSNSGGVSVETRQPSKRNVTFIVDYRIVIPEWLDVNVEHVNGDITMDDLSGEIQVYLTNGDVKFLDCLSSIWTNLTNGQVDANLALPQNGTCNFSITNGTIKLMVPDSTNAEFDAGIVNGSIAISGLNMTDSEVSNKSAKGMLGSGEGMIKLRVTNGAIRVKGLSGNEG